MQSNWLRLLFSAGLVATVLVVLAAGMLERSPQQPAAVSPSSSAPSSVSASAVPATPNPTPVPTAVQPPLFRDPVPFEGAVGAVLTVGDRFVAVGRLPSGDLAAWTSADGVAWDRHAIPWSLPAGEVGGADVGHLVEHDGWLYAIGLLAGPGDGRQPLGWRSQDGISWEAIESDSEFYRSAYLVLGVSSSGSALVAVSHGYTEGEGRIWRWTLDTSWDEVATEQTAQRGDEFFDIAFGHGRFVVVGSRELRTTGASWISDDGVTWRGSSDEGGGTAYLSAVAAAPGGWAAFGVRDAEAVSLWSDDGLAWQEADQTSQLAGEAGYITRLGAWLVAVGGSDGSSWVTASVDGRTWGEPQVLSGIAPRHNAVQGPQAAQLGSTAVLFLRGPEPGTSVLYRAEAMP